MSFSREESASLDTAFPRSGSGRQDAPAEDMEGSSSMRNRILASLAALLTSTSLTFAQDPLPTGEPTAPPSVRITPTPVTPAAPDCYSGAHYTFATDDHSSQAPRIWASAEYLLWWLRDAPLGTPIVTTATPGNIAAAIAAGQAPGAVGSIGTQLVNPSTLNYDHPLSGGRFTLGAWLGCDSMVGVEGSGFLMQSRSAQFAVNSPEGGQIFFIPFFDFALVPPAENAFPFGAVGSLSGTIQMVNRTEFWGAEVNGLIKLAETDTFSLSLLAGVRYLDLHENLDLGFVGIAPGGFAITSSLDTYDTRNQFWGGQLGARGELHRGGFFANVTGKVALGTMHEVVNATGFANVTAAGINATVPGGFFVLPSNIGQQSHNAFAVVPQVGAQIGYDVTRNIRVFAGYDFLYVSDVVRPGDQIDRRINFSQQAAPVGGGALVGQPMPQPQFNHNDFWAHGFSFGVQVRY
jgi:hypothetical protein